jgi:hypothetical protein
MEREVILTFNTDGTVEKEAVGFNGKGCKETTEFIEKALGATNQKFRAKPEYTRQEDPNTNRSVRA